MAIRIQTYWKTVDAPREQIIRDVNMCKTQDYILYYLFKTYGTLTAEDALLLCNDYGYEIKESSLRRSIDTLKDQKNNCIREVGTTRASTNRMVTMYTLSDENVEVIKTIRKQLPDSIKVDLVLEEDGSIDISNMIDQLTEQIVFLTTKYKL